jgi:hypothetical protein
VELSWLYFATSCPLLIGTILGEGYLKGVLLGEDRPVVKAKVVAI